MKPFDGFEENKGKISVIISQREKEKREQPYEQPRIWDRVYEYSEPVKDKKKETERGVCIIQF